MKFKWSFQAPALWPAAVLTTVVFVLLKVTDHIGWPWVWVLAPLWIVGCLALLLFVVLLLTLPVLARKLRAWR